MYSYWNGDLWAVHNFLFTRIYVLCLLKSLVTYYPFSTAASRPIFRHRTKASVHVYPTWSHTGNQYDLFCYLLEKSCLSQKQQSTFQCGTCESIFVYVVVLCAFFCIGAQIGHIVDLVHQSVLGLLILVCLTNLNLRCDLRRQCINCSLSIVLLAQIHSGLSTNP